MEELMRELIGMVKTVSPIIWEAAIRQVYASAIADTIWALLWIAGVTVSSRASKWAWKRREENDGMYAFLFAIFILCAIICAVLVLVCINSVVLSLVAPEYQAIKNLADLVK